MSVRPFSVSPCGSVPARRCLQGGFALQGLCHCWSHRCHPAPRASPPAEILCGKLNHHVWKHHRPHTFRRGLWLAPCSAGTTAEHRGGMSARAQLTPGHAGSCSPAPPGDGVLQLPWGDAACDHPMVTRAEENLSQQTPPPKPLACPLGVYETRSQGKVTQPAGCQRASCGCRRGNVSQFWPLPGLCKQAKQPQLRHRELVLSCSPLSK